MISNKIWLKVNLIEFAQMQIGKSPNLHDVIMSPLSYWTYFRKSRAGINFDDDKMFSDCDRTSSQFHVNPVGVAAVVKLTSWQAASGGSLIQGDIL